MGFLRAVALLSILLASVLPAAAAPEAPANDGTTTDIYRRMVALNANVASFTATTHVDVTMRSFPFIKAPLDGTVYYKRPDKQAIVFDTLPALAGAFKKVYPNLPAPAHWTDEFNVALVSDDGATTLFRLTKKKQGRIDHLDVKVDDRTATPVSFTYTYVDGGYVTFDQQYMAVGNDYMIKSQTGHVELPSYKADVTSAFSDYKLNVAIADSVFEQ